MYNFPISWSIVWNWQGLFLSERRLGERFAHVGQPILRYEKGAAMLKIYQECGNMKQTSGCKGDWKLPTCPASSICASDQERPYRLYQLDLKINIPKMAQLETAQFLNGGLSMYLVFPEKRGIPTIRTDGRILKDDKPCQCLWIRESHLTWALGVASQVATTLYQRER